MNARTAMDIALYLDAASCSSFVKLEAAEALRKQHAEIERLIAERDAAIASADALRAALLDIHALRPIGLSASVYALTVENIARSAIAKAAEEKA